MVRPEVIVNKATGLAELDFSPGFQPKRGECGSAMWLAELDLWQQRQPKHGECGSA